MVEEIRIYFEGDRRLRIGFHSFFGSIIGEARKRQIRFQLVAGGATPIRDFMNAVRAHPDSFNLLLVDSDAPDDGTLIRRVKAHADWDASVARVVNDEQIHFMVQVMESWFLADRDALLRFYGAGFREGRLPGNPAEEQIPKVDVLEGLRHATRATQKGTYHKTQHAPKLLGIVSPDRVRSSAPACERLFDTLERVVSGASSRTDL